MINFPIRGEKKQIKCSKKENELIYSNTIIYSNELIDVKIRKYFEYKIVKENSKDKISNDAQAKHDSG